MKCPTCLKELSKKNLDSFDIAMCDSCRGMWVDSFTFEEIKHLESPFSDLLKIRIWDDMKEHKVTPTTKHCPQCTKRLFKSDYADSDVSIDICPSCHSIWFERGELEKVISYIDKEISRETIGDLFNELGEGAKKFLIGQEPIDKEIKHIGLVLKLMEYRVFSKFPFLQKLANSLPI